MTLPFITCICPIEQLTERLVHEFRAQDYQGEKELIDCDSFEQGCELAHGQLLVPWRPTHLHLPHHLSNFFKGGFDIGLHGWVRQSKQFVQGGKRIVGVNDPGMAAFAFRKDAWVKSAKEGNRANLPGKISHFFDGVVVAPANSDVSLIELDAQSPASQSEILSMIKAHLGAIATYRSRNSDKIALVSLGHCGDILNVLPIAKHIADRYEPPIFVTSKMYGQVLEAVSYVKPVYLDLHDRQILQAIGEAEKLADTVITLQVHGELFKVDRLAESYNVDAWRQGGLYDEFHNVFEFPLELDRRSPERELHLYESALAGQDQTKPLIVANLTGGWSSPFPEGKQMLQRLLVKFHTHCNIVDLQRIQAPYIFDILGLLDRAAVLVSTDTYTLHLATASNVPVVAITNDTDKPFGRQWLRTTLRKPAVFESVYSRRLDDWPTIEKVIEELV